jgi:hypothetical protein
MAKQTEFQKRQEEMKRKRKGIRDRLLKRAEKRKKNKKKVETSADSTKKAKTAFQIRHEEMKRKRKGIRDRLLKRAEEKEKKAATGPKRTSFGEAFAKARKEAQKGGDADKGIFSWRGKKYTTKLAEEKKDKPKPKPKKKRHASEFVGTGPRGAVDPKHILQDKPPKSKRALKPLEGGKREVTLPKFLGGDEKKKMTVDSSDAAFDYMDDPELNLKSGGRLSKRAALRGGRAELRGG